jgi:hypothetical protein
MKAVKTYSTKVDADVAKIALAAADVPSVVVGVGTELEGGSAGVQLLVPDECVEAALSILERSCSPVSPLKRLDDARRLRRARQFRRTPASGQCPNEKQPIAEVRVGSSCGRCAMVITYPTKSR